MKKAFPLLMIFALSGALAGHAPAQTTNETKPANDPAAVAALHDMGNYLRTLKVFQVQAASTTDDILDDGQKIQFGGTIDVLVQRPNHLRVKIISDRQDRRFFYDGKTFSLFAPLNKFYAIVPAPATINELINHLVEKYGIETPLADLFTWGTPEANDASIIAAAIIGPSTVDGASCTHYAFRQPGLDWQIWIQNGENPLPRKLVLTTITDETRPQHSSVYTWNLAPAYNEAAFTFVPPEGAAPIPLIEIKMSNINLPETSP